MHNFSVKWKPMQLGKATFPVVDREKLFFTVREHIDGDYEWLVSFNRYKLSGRAKTEKLAQAHCVAKGFGLYLNHLLLTE